MSAAIPDGSYTMAEFAEALFAPRAVPRRQIFPGYIMSLLRGAMKGTEATIADTQCNGVDCVYQARVTLADDPTVYRLILAPADAPIQLYGRPIGDAFAQPLGGAL